ncbi:hypothetical protein ACFQV2_23275 [Actinokineospora soli]|uniref:Uncharacterized protein n=1 Tax=Actinokineospora soli TaxID=1048753 RepID=A0ABW2TRH7_9PSEU
MSTPAARSPPPSRYAVAPRASKAAPTTLSRTTRTPPAAYAATVAALSSTQYPRSSARPPARTAVAVRTRAPGGRAAAWSAHMP